MSAADEEFRRASAEQLQDDRRFYIALASALGHYATVLHEIGLHEMPGCRDPLIAEVLRTEVHRRLEQTKP
jgi:hypothetical protein